MDAVTITSAPGYLYAAGYAVAAVMICLTKPPRGPFWRRMLLWIGLTIADVYLQYRINLGLPSLFLATLLVALAFSLGILLCTCDISRKAAVYFLFYAFLLGEFLTALSWQIYLFLLLMAWTPNSTQIMTVCFAAMSILVLIFAWLFHRKYYAAHSLSQLDNREVLLSFVTAICIYLFSNISNVYHNTPFSGQTEFQINLIRLLVDAGGLILLSALRMFRAEAASRAEVAILQNLMEAQYRNYQTSERSIALIHQKYHDLKHQIAYLRDEMPDAARQQYLDRMENEIRVFEAAVNTGNHVMDTILTDKSLQCREREIQLSCAADGRLLDFIDPLDLSALLGNLLDNAIEHAGAISDPALRWIEFAVRKKNSFVILEVGNHYEGDIVFQDGLPQTTKSDARYHGYGTKSIRNTVSAYGGTVNFSAEDGWFWAKISFVRAG